jgi:hypothetical protein
MTQAGLGREVSAFNLRPREGRTTDDVEAAVAEHIGALLGAPLSRTGNVTSCHLLRRLHGDEFLLLVGVDTSPARFKSAIHELESVATLHRVGEYGPVELPQPPETRN